VTLLKYIQESKVPEESDAELTRELHVVQSHLLQYESLLHAFHVSVSFLEKTPYPIIESEAFSEEQRKISNELMKTVCGNLLGEINRITKRREMLGDRTKNALNLVFANVNIRDSASMRLVPYFPQTESPILINYFSKISYLTMIFLPASFMAVSIDIFRMEPWHLTTVVLSLFSGWTSRRLRDQHLFRRSLTTLRQRLCSHSSRFISSSRCGRIVRSTCGVLGCCSVPRGRLFSSGSCKQERRKQGRRKQGRRKQGRRWRMTRRRINDIYAYTF
jgi:hypothetical protein